MPIPIPINEVTGVIAVAVIGLTYMFRKRLWRKATNWINGDEPAVEHRSDERTDSF